MKKRKAISSAGRSFAILLLALTTGEAAVGADAKTVLSNDKVLTVEEETEGEFIWLVIKPLLTIEATVLIKVESENMNCSTPLPLTVLTEGWKPVRALKLWSKDRTKPYKFYWHFDSTIGRPYDSIVDRNYHYELPYQAGQSFKIVQTYFGAFSHNSGSQNEYAIDFGMPEGTTVCAAREGTVVAARSDSDTGGPDKGFINSGNFIIIRHPDQSYAKYWHLKHDGCLVRIGDSVKKGQAIGLSGNTGYSGGPHLHFEAYNIKSATWKDSMPVIFETSTGALSKLEEGESYEKPLTK